MGPGRSYSRTLGRPHRQELFASATVRNILTVGPSQSSYGLAPRKLWTCGFTLSVDMRPDAFRPPQIRRSQIVNTSETALHSMGACERMPHRRSTTHTFPGPRVGGEMESQCASGTCARGEGGAVDVTSMPTPYLPVGNATLISRPQPS